MASSDAPYWLQFIQPFATVFLGLGAAVLAVRQWLTAHEKLRLDLFDKRISSLENYNSKLFHAAFPGRASMEAANDCHNLSIRMRLLFGSDVGSTLIAIDGELDHFVTGDDNRIAEISRLQLVLNKEVEPYLQFRSRRPRFWFWRHK